MLHRWRAGGILVQFLPDDSGRVRRQDLPGGDVPDDSVFDMPDEDDSWIEALSLVDTVEDHELTDPSVPVERLLYRLFHERGVRVFTPAAVRDRFSCSRQRVEAMLGGFSTAEIEESIENDAISVTCEFCGAKYVLDPQHFMDAADENGGSDDRVDS
jgi:molecular chaperone Hsp33